ncbi:MMPL family transporter [Haloferax sp. MBLA0076]|uniref:MMPL family transporter n=1 Tax=Haloferax litoreum TaxID=2666140 RepID=A0A6A8GH21_9EURY|nr:MULTISPECIES: MMPL family transporter [Haloferax]KAB1193923.1 MMPL family transporter [Haloferax sp. CBA1148]MRX22468.1 MMPL family transporter [Haloferax litoreum]
MIDYEVYVDRLGGYITAHPGRVIALFFVATLVFGAGLGNISTDAGTSQFTDSSPAQEALDDVNREFSPAFETSSGSTQLIQQDSNVLSKPAMLDMLRLQERIMDRPSLRATSASSVASTVAQTLDPSATTLEEQIAVLESSSPAEVRAAAKQATANPNVASLLSNDFNRESVKASSTIGVVSHEVPGISSSAGTSGTSPMTDIQVEIQTMTSVAESDITVFGSGIISSELGNVIADSLLLVVPAAVLLIFGFLVIAYRDPIDLLLGVISLGLAIIWTFGFMGLADIPFSQMLIAVPPLLLAVGIDFGLHAVNRYREERVKDVAPVPSMRTTVKQLSVAFFIVTGTTVLGFLANVTSDLGPIQDFGLVAAVGILFTFLVFGVFLPAAKLYVDQLRQKYNVPEFASAPLGSEGGLLARVLSVGVFIGRRAPRAFLVLVLVTTVVAGSYGTGVDTSFSQEDFLPPEEQADYLQQLPEPFKPGVYTVTKDLNYLEDNFETTQGDSVTIYIEGQLREDSTLEMIHRNGEDPPETFITEDRRAESTSIVTVIQSYAAQDPEFAALVARNDANGNGVPDDNLDMIYDELLSSPVSGQASSYITEDYRKTRIVYTVEGDAEQDAIVADGQEVADRLRMSGVATGNTVVFKAVSDTIFMSAIQSLVVALVATAVFLVFIYQLLEGQWTLGVVNLVPIVVTLALLAGSMRYFGIPLNALTATILAIAIGLGIDYSAHVVHRFADEYNEGSDLYEALHLTVGGTGGALTGSMLTTTTGLGVLAIAITPVLGQFGIVTALSIFYSYLTALVVTPPALVVWERLTQRETTTAATTSP